MTKTVSPDILDELWASFDYCPETGVMTSRRTGKAVGCVGLRGYMTMRVAGQTFRVHRLAWLHFYGRWPEHHIDHINHIRNDNRIANLRDVPQGVNNQNVVLAPCGRNTLIGAARQGRGYIAQISVGGKTKTLGTYLTAEQAHHVYVEAKRRLHEGNTL